MLKKRERENLKATQEKYRNQSVTLWWLSKVKPMLGGPVWSAQLTLMSSKVEHMSPTDQ